MKRSCAAIHPMPPSTITKRSFGKRCGTAEVISSARLRCIINIFLSQTGQDGGEHRFAYSGSAIGVLLGAGTRSAPFPQSNREAASGEKGRTQIADARGRCLGSDIGGASVAGYARPEFGHDGGS